MPPVRLIPLLAVWAAAAAPTLFPPRDFVEYWSAARVYLRGGDPYDGAQLLPLQREAGDPERAEPTMLWTPPWTLPLYIPFGLLPPGPAHLAWLAVQAVCVFVSVWLLWRVYGGPAARDATERLRWILVRLAVIACFAPAWWLFIFGQNTAFLLLGLAGFLYLRQRDYPVAAGAVAALTAIKPHLLALFGLALLLDAATRSGRRVLLGGVGALLAASAVAVLIDPGIFGKFVAALGRDTSAKSVSVADWQLPLFSYRLRMWLAPGRFWVQFLPLAAGCALLLPYWWLRRREWDWTTQVPRLVLASVLLAPYGAWIFDLVVLLVPVLQVVTRVATRPQPVPILVAAVGYIALFPLGFRINQLQDAIWFAPAVLAWYVAVILACRPTVTPTAEARS
jgi:hypothetical protein